jgi:5-amino-6-(5-phosphoribosylamino)uracil reductase
MQRLWPLARTAPAELSDAELADVYAYPESLGSPWVRMNFVSSADGAATAGGVTKDLATSGDRRVMRLLRELAEVILVGAGTVRAENYRGARKPSRCAGPPPPIAVVTATAQLDPAARLFTDTTVPPLILASAASSEANRRRLVDAGAEVVALPGERLSADTVLAELERRGWRRVLCEGGPHLFGQLLAADVVDELCLTVSALLAGGAIDRIAMGPDHPLRPLRLASVLTEQDALLLRYLRDRDRD